MFGWIELSLLAAALTLFLLRCLPRLRSYRALLVGGGALLLITAVFPRTSNPLGQFLFGTTGEGPQLPRQLFEVAWWVLGAWLLKSLLDLVLLRTFFPENGEPHARRLFADLASGLIYVLAFVGIVGTVFNEPVSTMLATSGVVAVVLGLALQNTLGDVLSGLAINIERPFAAGDWISLPDRTSGQVMQVNWRATRLKSWSHDMVVIPNSVVSKSIVTNHSRPKGPHRCIIRFYAELGIAPVRVIAALLAASADSPNVVRGTTPQAYACGFSDSAIDYELVFAIESFALLPGARSEMICRIADTFHRLEIKIGAAVTDIRIVGPSVADRPAAAPRADEGPQPDGTP